jgi:hypothetical protein
VRRRRRRRRREEQEEEGREGGRGKRRRTRRRRREEEGEEPREAAGFLLCRGTPHGHTVRMLPPGSSGCSRRAQHKQPPARGAGWSKITNVGALLVDSNSLLTLHSITVAARAATWHDCYVGWTWALQIICNAAPCFAAARPSPVGVQLDYSKFVGRVS